MKYRILLKTPPGFRDEIKIWTRLLLSDSELEFSDHELGFSAILNAKQIVKVLTRAPWFEDIMIAVLWRSNVPHREYIIKELKNAFVFFKDIQPLSVGLAVRIKQDSIHTVKRVREAFSKIFANYKVHGQDLPSELEALILIEKGKMTFLLSLSGSGLYKRGQRDVKGFLAPMREDLAASLLTMTMPNSKFKLWLPFAGSGTYFFECYELAREFLHPGRNNFFARKVQLFDFAGSDEAQKESLLEHAFLEDIHKDSIQKMSLDLSQMGLTSLADVSEADFFKTKSERFIEDSVYLPINPPWGQRLGKTVDAEFFRRIGKKISEMKFRKLECFVLCPDEKSSHAFCQGYGLGSEAKIHHFTQGGKHIRAVIISK